MNVNVMLMKIKSMMAFVMGNVMNDNCYVYGVGACGFFGQGSNLYEMVWADNIVEAMQQIRLEIPVGVISIRKAVYGEWECDNFTLAGHYPHADQ
jgi:hypothetical protein